MSNSGSTVVLQKYRALYRLLKRLPEPAARSCSPCPEESFIQVRSSFRTPLGINESLDERLRKADERISFLKMITPKMEDSTCYSGCGNNVGDISSGGGGGGRWIYRDGKSIEITAASSDERHRESNGSRVISNWDGNNLDPDSVKRHKYQLNRMGFRSNLHAKGIF